MKLVDRKAKKVVVKPTAKPKTAKITSVKISHAGSVTEIKFKSLKDLLKQIADFEFFINERIIIRFSGCRPWKFNVPKSADKILESFCLMYEHASKPENRSDVLSKMRSKYNIEP